jgi:transcriptional regulator GlxA family with amidase domain
MRVSILALDGVFDSGLAIVLDTLVTANELRGRPLFDISVVGVRRSVTTCRGFKVPLARAADEGPRAELAIVPALGCKTPETLAAALERPDVADACAQLGAWSKAGVRVAAACTATFVLAASGILDGGRATTTWWLSPIFRERFPSVTLDESQMIVRSGRVVTAGAALAHVDLALWLVRERSPSIAEATARYLVFDARPSQAAFVIPDHLAHSDPVVERFEHWARRNLARFSLEDAARAVGASERTLERRMRAVLGRTPLSYVQDLRVELAVHRLRTTQESIEQIAPTVGYRDGVTLRTLLRKKTGRGIRELRVGASSARG